MKTPESDLPPGVVGVLGVFITDVFFEPSAKLAKLLTGVPYGVPESSYSSPEGLFFFIFSF